MNGLALLRAGSFASRLYLAVGRRASCRNTPHDGKQKAPVAAIVGMGGKTWDVQSRGWSRLSKRQTSSTITTSASSSSSGGGGFLEDAPRDVSPPDPKTNRPEAIKKAIHRRGCFNSKGAQGEERRGCAFK